ncbi:MAG: tetratricopeptide repeat protein, partial [Rhodocyclaceae bacterium]|nr:tetratricopeptide repeat protein [Rhodocyclaceae bacterium]
MSHYMIRALRAASVALAVGLPVAVSTFARAEEEAPAARPLPKLDLTPQILYQFLLAEIAGNRGNLALSSSAYLDLAKTTRDPRIARRAAEIAFFSRQLGPALEAAKLWVELEPDSTQARQTLAGLLVAANRTEDLAGQLGRMLATEQDKATALLLLNRTLARHPDKKAILRVVTEVTEPYLSLPEAHFARSVAAQAAGEAAAALESADRALALRPDWEHAILNKVRLISEEPAKALAILSDYLSRNPEARDARLAYARLLVADKRYDEARKEFQGLLAAHGDKPDVVYAIGVLSLQLRDLPEAEKQFKRLLEIGPADADQVRFYLGQIAEETRRWDEAVSWYGSVAGGEQISPARARAAGILAKQGRLDEGRRLLQDFARS